MKYVKADLLSDVVGSYDQTKTTIQGRVAQKTISGVPVLGPPQARFLDVFTDTLGIAPGVAMYPSPNGRIFVVGTAATGVGNIFLYNFNYTDGTSSYVGRLNFSLPHSAATTWVVKGLRVIDTGTTGWKIFFAAAGSVLINGGTFVLNNVDLADFVPIGSPTLPFATGNDQKAVYLDQNPAAIGVGQLEVAPNGFVLDAAANRIYTHNGVTATHQMYVRDTSAAMTYTSASVNVTVAAPGKVQYVAHPYLANDPVTFTAGTLPTGLVVGTVYFVRNPSANDFELSATSGGASIATTGSPSVGAIIGRAFGTTSSAFLFRTGNLPTVTGAFLSNDSFGLAIPVSSPLNGVQLNGNKCAFLCTASNMYLGLLSDLTNLGTTWPSLTASNLLGAVNQILAPTATFAGWFNTLDRALIVTNATKFVMKQLENTNITMTFGQLSNTQLVTAPTNIIQAGAITFVSTANESGWLFVAGGTAGQQGIIAIDLRSDSLYDYSYIVTKVMNTPNSQVEFIKSLEQLSDQTGEISVSYRTSGFGSISGGWISIPSNYTSLTSIPAAAQIQFKIGFRIQADNCATGAQVSELILGMIPANDIDDNWEYSRENSSNGVPTRASFRLKTAYASTVPTLYFRAFDLSDLLLVNHNTVTNSANFEYSTNDGVSWLPLGTIPNTVGTLIRYNFSSPPGVDIRPGLRLS